jgi:hypothetical protein
MNELASYVQCAGATSPNPFYFLSPPECCPSEDTLMMVSPDGDLGGSIPVQAEYADTLGTLLQATGCGSPQLLDVRFVISLHLYLSRGANINSTM